MSNKTLVIWDKKDVHLKDIHDLAQHKPDETAKVLASFLVENTPGNAYDLIVGAIANEIRELNKPGHSHLMNDDHFIEGHIRGAINKLAGM